MNETTLRRLNSEKFRATFVWKQAVARVLAAAIALFLLSLLLSGDSATAREASLVGLVITTALFFGHFRPFLQGGGEAWVRAETTKAIDGLKGRGFKL